MIKRWNTFNETYIPPSAQREEGKYDSILSELKSLNLTSEQIYNLVDEYFFDYKVKDEKDPKSEIDVDKTLKKMSKYFTNREDEYERFMKFFGK